MTFRPPAKGGCFRIDETTNEHRREDEPAPSVPVAMSPATSPAVPTIEPQAKSEPAPRGALDVLRQMAGRQASPKPTMPADDAAATPEEA